MSFAFKTGAFTSSGSSGNQAVTGVGFQPKALILFTTSQVSTGADTFAVFGMGMATGTSDQRFAETRSFHNNGAVDAAIANVSGNIYHRSSFGASLVGPSGTISAFGSDGFTINWSVSHTAFLVGYIALAGDDLTNVNLDTFSIPGATGSQAYTGVGFQPDAMIVFGASIGNAASTTDPLSYFLGFSDGTNQVAAGWGSDEGSDPSNTCHIVRDDRLISILDPASNAVYNQASVSSFDADGFTLNWDVRSASHQFFALCLKGGSYKCGKDAYKTTTGTQQTPTGFTPKGVIIVSGGEAAGSTVRDGVRMSIGAGDGTTMRALGYVDQDNLATTVCRRYTATTESLNLRSADGASAVAVADIDSFDTDTGFTLDFTTVDGGTRDFIYFAAGDNTGGTEHNESAASSLSLISAAIRNADFGRAAEDTLDIQQSAVNVEDDEFLVKAGSFLSATSNGLQSITGVGFQPKCVILWTANDSAANADAIQSAARMFFGCAGEATEGAISFNARHLSAADVSAIGHRNDSCLVAYGDAAALQSRASLDSYGVDGFTLDWTGASATAFVVNYLAIGGSILEEAKVTAHQVPGSTGSQAITGVGFEPDAMVLFGVSLDTLNLSTVTDPISMSIGYTDGVRQGVTGVATDRGADPMDTYHVQRTDRIYTTINGQTDAIYNEASLTSLDADGFTLNWHTRTASHYFFSLCLKGGRYHVGSDTQGTSIGTKAATGIPFLPSAIMLQSGGTTPSTSLQPHAMLTVGVSDSLANKSVSLAYRDGDGTSIAQHYTATAAISILGTAGALVGRANVHSLDDAGFTLDWMLTDGAAREFLYFALGAPPNRQYADSDLSGSLDQDVTLLVEWYSPAESTLTLVQEAIASGPKTAFAVSALELLQQGYSPGDIPVSAVSALTLVSTGEPHGVKYADASSIIELVSLADNIIKARSATSILELLDSVTATSSKKAKNTLILTQLAERAIRATGTNSLLGLSQFATVPLDGQSTLFLSQSAVFVPPSATKLSKSTLTLTQLASVMKDLGLSPMSIIALSQAVAVVVSSPTLCQYDPEGLPTLDGPDEPSFIKGLKLMAADMDEVEITRSMNLGDIDRLAFDRIYRETRGGTLVVFANPIWPKIETLVFSLSAVKRTTAQAVLTFLRDHLGEAVTLTTYEGRQWSGVVMNPQSAVIEDRRNSFTISIEFEGSEV